MNNKASWLLCILLGAALVPLGVTGQPTGVEYMFIIDCPDARNTRGGPVPQYACPVKAEDQADIMGDPSLAVDPLEPQNLVIASLHGAVGRNETARASAGGGGVGVSGPVCAPNNPGPTPRSRCGQPFTTFTSTQGGAGNSWIDNPFSPPSQVQGAYGEHPQLTIDPYGRVYIGSLYAQPRGDGAFDYTIVAQKFSSLENINSEQDGEYNAEYLDPIYKGNSIGQMWFLFNAQTDNMTMVWHEQVTPFSEPKDLPVKSTCTVQDQPTRGGSSSSTSQSGSSTSGSSTSGSSTSGSSTSGTSSSSSSSSSGTSSSSTSSSGTGTSTSSSSTSSAPVRLPLSLVSAIDPPAIEALGDPQPSPIQRAGPTEGTQGPDGPDAGPRSVIGVVWTGSSSGSCYQYQPYEWTIGPCLKSTNPVLSEGWLYVGCVSRTDEGEFSYHPETIAGTVEMFRMRPDGGEPQYIGASGIIGGSPKLGVRSDGRLALATTTATDGILSFNIDFGQYDPQSKRIEWSSRNSFGSKLEKVDPALRIVDANIQDLIFREHSGVVQLILKERVAAGTGVNSATHAVGPEYRKFIVAIDETYGLLAKLPLDVGNIVNRTDSTLLQTPEEAFDDLSDDFLQLPNQRVYEYTEQNGVVHILENYQREFFAVADYGIVIFAELIEITTLRGPAFGNPPPPAPATPAPATAASSINAGVPAAGLTMAGALALALLANKRKEAVLNRAGRGKRR